jgi:hypothetical protein
LTAPRILGLLGAAITAVASLLPWYRYDVLLASGNGAAARTANGAVDLWSVDPAAGVLVTGAALAAALLLLFAPGHHLRAARHVACAFGLAIAAYALVRWVQAPDLAQDIQAVRRADVVTGGASVDVGVFIVLLGGAALMLAALEPSASIAPAPVPVTAETLATEPAPAVTT